MVKLRDPSTGTPSGLSQQIAMSENFCQTASDDQAASTKSNQQIGKFRYLSPDAGKAVATRYARLAALCARVRA